MNYCNCKNKYYVDGYEHKDVINSRWKILKKYLTNEPRIYRWVQIILK